MPISMYNDPKQSAVSTRPKPPVKQSMGSPKPQKPVFTDWAMI